MTEKEFLALELLRKRHLIQEEMARLHAEERELVLRNRDIQSRLDTLEDELAEINISLNDVGKTL